MKKHTQSPYESSKVSYKPSGIDYLGLIPHHWEVARSGLIYKNISSGTTPQSDNDEYYKNGNIFWINSGDLNDSVLTNSKNKITQRAIMAYSVLKIFPKGSLIIAMYGATIGKVSILGIDACTNQACCVLCESKYLNTRFVFYYFIAKRQDLISMAYGGGQPNISQDIIKNFKIPLPPLQEQKEIVEFLDSKCEKIQNYIDKKQKLITLLQEKKQALINKVVTKGLNPNIEFKNSGIEYLGLIPHHWEAVKVKFTAYVKGRIGFHGLNSNEFRYDEGAYLVTGNDFDNNEVMWDKCRRVSEERFYEDPNIHLQNNDLLITKDGTIGKTAIVNNCPKQATLNSGIFLVRTLKEMCFVKYLFFIINSQYFKEFVNVKTSGSTIKHLYQSDFHDLKIPLPPLQEQKQIANFLDEKCEKINSAIEKTKRQIELIKEYKNTLINEAVCGRVACHTEPLGEVSHNAESKRDFSPTAQNDKKRTIQNGKEDFCHTERSEVSTMESGFFANAQNDKKKN
ncbi:TPA: restriction endonuclease subunit S [Campylobacter upsaliensis]|nr:restriction endonuclease subunit S [Campylobacter upsaliensis]